MDENDEPDVFQRRLRGSLYESLLQDDDHACRGLRRDCTVQL